MTISNREVIDEFEQTQGQGDGQQLGGGPGAADQDAVGGSSGSGGYGKGEKQSEHQGQKTQAEKPATRELSRGERYDMEQGGGRAADAVDFEQELTEDQQAHQDRGQGFLGSEGERDTGAVTEGQQP